MLPIAYCGLNKAKSTKYTLNPLGAGPRCVLLFKSQIMLV